MKDCPRCGRSVADSAMFCTGCGLSLSATPPKPAPPAPVQPKPVPPAPVLPNPAPPKPATPAPAPAKPVTPAPAPAKPAQPKPATPKVVPPKAAAPRPKATESTLCPKCGLPRNQSGQFCTGCGTVLDPNVMAKISAYSPPPKTNWFLRFICIAIAVILVVVFLGQRLKNQESAKLSITITVHLNPNGNSQTSDWLNSMENQFAAQYPEYNITWVNEDSSLEDTLGDMIWDSSSAADIYFYDSSNLQSLVDAGALLPLSNYSRSDYSDTLNSAVQPHNDSEYYGYPVSQDTWCLYYDKEVFNETDISYVENMLAEGRVCLPLLDPQAAGCFFLGAGCTIFGDDGKDISAGFDFNNEYAYAVAKKLPGLMQNGNAYISTLGADALMDGTSSAAFATSSDYTRLKEYLGDKLGVAPLPSFSINGERFQMTALSSVICVGVNPGCNDGTAKQQLCLDFAAYISSADSQTQRFKADGTVPATLKALEDTHLTDNEPLIVAEIENMRDATVLRMSCSEMDNYYKCMESYIQGILEGTISVSNYRQSVEYLNDRLNA